MCKGTYRLNVKRQNNTDVTYQKHEKGGCFKTTYLVHNIKSVDIHSAIVSLQREDVGNVADVKEVVAVSIFRADSEDGG
jgi:hypothetical protein